MDLKNLKEGNPIAHIKKERNQVSFNKFSLDHCCGIKTNFGHTWIVVFTCSSIIYSIYIYLIKCWYIDI